MERDRTLKLSGTIRQVLAGVRRQIRFRVLVDGLLVASLSVLLLFWLGAAVDYLPVRMGSNETPRWVRAVVLVLMGALVAWALLWRMARRYFARMTNRNLAVLLERHFPELNNELVTVVELADRPAEQVSNPSAYRSMLDRVQHSAEGRVQQLDTRPLLDWRAVRWQAGAVTVLVLLTLGMAVARPAWINLWSARLFALSDQRWPRMARLEVQGIQMQLPAFTGQTAADRVNVSFAQRVVQVPRGGAATLHVKADASAALVPELCTLFYQMADGARGRANMRRLGAPAEGWQAFLLDGPPLVDLTSDVTFDIVGGDARLDDYVLQVVDPGVITSMRLDVAYPTYLLASHSNLPAREQLEFRTGMRIPEGTQVILSGEASRPLRKVEYVVRSVSARGGRAPATPTSVSSDGQDLMIQTVEPRGKEFAIPLGGLNETVVVEIRVQDEFGLTGDQIPRYVVTVAEDAVPEVEAKLVGIGTAVTPKAVLPVLGKATDDHALARVWTTIVVNEQPPVEINVDVEPDGALKPRIDLVTLAESGQLRLPTDATLGLALSATDRYDLSGLTHTGHGQPIQLAIVDEQKLLIMLDRQELEIRQRLELIISELGQLRDVLREQAGAATSEAKGTDTANGHIRDAIRSLALTVSLPVQQAPGQPPADTPVENPDTDSGPDPEQRRRMTLLRAQQSVLQADKSQQELVGVAGRVDDVRLQLINNRIDSIDRQARLLDKVYQPLQATLASEMEAFRSRLAEFQTAATSPGGAATQAGLAADENERLLAALNAIVANMLDIESFNEVVDAVRDIRDDVEQIMKDTQQKQKQSLLDALK